MTKTALAHLLLAAILATITLSACGGGDDDDTGGDDDDDIADDDSGDCPADSGDSATSGSLTPTLDPVYYVDQSLKYFDTLDSYADPNSVPAYSELVARWEWPPWLKLTGLGAEQMELIDRLLRLYPTSVPIRDCRFFDTQPFGRCHVVFYYQGDRPCPIYEEFTFNKQGEMTFIEAWSDLPGMLPTSDPADVWAEGEGVHRLSTKVPGLGNEAGLIDLDGDCMAQAADRDEDIADFLTRAQNPVLWWVREFLANPDSFDVGCGWGTGTKGAPTCAEWRQSK